MAKAKIKNYNNDTPVVTLDNPKKDFNYNDAEKILRVKHLKQYFRFGRGKYKYTKAVHDISFDIYKGEVFGLVGESGCGKSTTGRSIIKLYKITSGDVWFKGIRIAAGTRWNEKEIKFTKIRLKEAIKKYKTETKNEIDVIKTDLTHLYQEEAKIIKEKFDAKVEEKNKQIRSVVEDDNDSQNLINQCNIDIQTLELERKEELKALKNKIKEKYNALASEVKEKYEKLIDAKIEEAEEIISTQREKIKKAHHDDSCCDKDIAKQEVAKVKEKYKHLFEPVDKVAAAKLTKDDPESIKVLELYNQYKKELKEAKQVSITRKMQMIFQDPIASLNPRMTVRNIIAEGLIIKGVKDKEFISSEVNRVLELVGLLPEHANRYPHEFSGGQRQRIGIARAIIMNPELIIADEPVSALDVSIQAQVINLLNDLRNNLGLTILFIAHNLSVVKYFCDRIAVMYYGSLMEITTSEELFKNPLHPYTKSLLSAVEINNFQTGQAIKTRKGFKK